MKAFTWFTASRTSAWMVVGTVACLAVGSLAALQGVEHEDDILAFLPQDNPDVRVFSDINKRFGGLDVALVGIQAPDVLDRDFLARLRRVTRDLKETKGLDHVLSLANVVDFTPDAEQGGVITSRLVDALPQNEDDKAALRTKVLSREHVVGNLVADNLEGVLIYCYLAYGADPKAMAARIQGVVRDQFSGERVYWGGGPFISSYIYNTTERDMHRLTPWAVLAIVVVMVLAFRDVVGSCLALLSTAIGIALSLGVMGLLGIRFNLMLSSMPVVLFAIGSAYGIHVLARYYRVLQTQSVKPIPTRGPQYADFEAQRTVRAINETLCSVGPTVLAAGMTTAAGLLSFIMMDIQPMKTFGVFTALGILFTLMLSLTFVPAVVRLVGLRRRPAGSLVSRTLGGRPVMARYCGFVAGHRVAFGVPLVAVAGVGAFFALRVDSRMDHSTFFRPNSPPAKAQTFLRQHFGGSQFIQLLVRGDMEDPEVLRELQRVADLISLMPHVSDTLHVGTAMAQVNEVMVGRRRIPQTRAQTKLLYAFSAGDPSFGQLVTSDRQMALVHVKVSSNLAADLEPLLERIEALTGAQETFEYFIASKEAGSDARVERIATRVEAIWNRNRRHGLTAVQKKQLRRELRSPRPAVPPDRVVAAIEGFLRSDEGANAMPQDNAERHVSAVSRRLANLGPNPSDDAVVGAVAGVLGRPLDDDVVSDVSLSVVSPLRDAWQRGQAHLQAVHLTGALDSDAVEQSQLVEAISTALLDFNLPRELMAVRRGAERSAVIGTLSYQVNGLPVMHRGLSQSVERNQFRSLAFALALIVLIMALLYRSLLTGLLVATPTLLTLLVVYGGMGFWGLRLDIGTSMLASLILGAGVDYAVHLTAAWNDPGGCSLDQAAANAAEQTGPAIWTNAIMVCAGFLVLATGEARPLQNVGALTGAAMLTAAVATFTVIPALARRSSYSRARQRLDRPHAPPAAKPALEDAREG